MRINRLATAIAAVVAFVSLNACIKDETRRFTGNYSFKTSGYITAIDTTADAVRRDITLGNESGQMDITRTEGDNMVVTMNITGGDILVFYAEAEGEELVLEPTTRKMRISSSQSGIPYTYDAQFRVDGRGRRYDNIVIFNMIYSGVLDTIDNQYNVLESNVVCRGKLNE